MTEKRKKMRRHFLSASLDYTLRKICLSFSPGNHFPSVINTDNFTRLGKTQLVLTGHCGGLTKLCVAPRLSAPIPIPEH